jgi:hypothetical protein
VYQSLEVDQLFGQKHQRFRVVLAGRHLAMEKDKIEAISSIPLTVEQLLPLTYNDLYETTLGYLSKNIKTAVVTEVATRIMHVTGGHPGCMASLLRLYKQTGELHPPNFFEFNAVEIQQVIEREIGQVQNDIPGELQGVIKVLGIFRQVNSHVLDFLINRGYIVGYNSGKELEDKLTTTYYLWRDGPLLRNDNHRLLGLRRREDPECARIAQRSCEDYLISKSSARRPETWVCYIISTSFYKAFPARLITLTAEEKFKPLYCKQKSPISLTYWSPIRTKTTEEMPMKRSNKY